MQILGMDPASLWAMVADIVHPCLTCDTPPPLQERLIALSRAKLQHWQALLSKQEALQDNTLFAGIGGS